MAAYPSSYALAFADPRNDTPLIPPTSTLRHPAGMAAEEVTYRTLNGSAFDPNGTDAFDDLGYISLEEYLDYINPKSWTWALIALHCVVFFVGLVGNCLVCVAVYRNHSMRTVTNYFIVNLAVADALVIVFCLPFSVIWDVTSTWWFGTWLCKVVLYLQSVSVTVSILTLAFISIDRWYAICFPLKFKSTTGRAKTAIGIIWIISMVCEIPEPIYLVAKPYSPRTVYFTQCAPTWSDEVDTGFMLVKMIMFYILPLLFMSAAYVQIIRVLWRSGSAPHHAMGDSGGCRDGGGAADGGGALRGRRLRHEHQRQHGGAAAVAPQGRQDARRRRRHVRRLLPPRAPALRAQADCETDEQRAQQGHVPIVPLALLRQQRRESDYIQLHERQVPARVPPGVRAVLPARRRQGAPLRPLRHVLEEDARRGVVAQRLLRQPPAAHVPRPPPPVAKADAHQRRPGRHVNKRASSGASSRRRSPSAVRARDRRAGQPAGTTRAPAPTSTATRRSCARARAPAPRSSRWPASSDGGGATATAASGAPASATPQN